MAVRLPPPPKTLSISEFTLWFESLWRRVSGNIVVTGDAVATIGSGETYHGVTALTAGRTLTLPSASDLQDGDSIVIQDESGSAGTYAITIQRAGTDTINGGASVTISSNYGRKTIIKRGTGKFYSA